MHSNAWDRAWGHCKYIRSSNSHCTIATQHLLLASLLHAFIFLHIKSICKTQLIRSSQISPATLPGARITTGERDNDRAFERHRCTSRETWIGGQINKANAYFMHLSRYVSTATVHILVHNRDTTASTIARKILHLKFTVLFLERCSKPKCESWLLSGQSWKWALVGQVHIRLWAQSKSHQPFLQESNFWIITFNF